MSKDSKDDIKLESLKKKGAEAFNGEIYFDSLQDTRKRSQSLPRGTKLNYEDSPFHDALSDVSPKSRTSSESSLGSTSGESSLSDSDSSKSVKSLKSLYERKEQSPAKKLENPTKGIRGIYAGKDIEEIRETIRKAVDPHTYQQQEGSSEITKGHYRHRGESKSRF